MDSETPSSAKESETGGSTDQYRQSKREIAHDLRNPLSIATQYLKLAQENPEDEHFNEIETSLKRIDEIITTELEPTQPGATENPLTTVEIPHVVERAWQTAKTQQATLNTQFGSESPPSVYMNESHLQSLFENLFRNAGEHAGDRVTVTVGELADQPGFYVADDGTGIPHDKRLDVFRAGYSTSDRGTGLGLQIVAEVTATYNWELVIGESESGGSRFEFHIPESNWVLSDV